MGVMGMLGPITALCRVARASAHGGAPDRGRGCFALGLVVRTVVGRRMLQRFEQRVLERIPGFAVVRGVARRISGQTDDSMFQPVLVEIEDALTPAFIVEELDDGRYVVLVPSVPTPAAGSLYILARERVHWLDVPVTQAVAVITKWGSGTGELVKAMRA
jgi:uncharacterized membrane protein